ncbi:MAG TPA: 2-oxoglutarate oxidoreductase, partial [Anaerolineaceae bacterium]|nr:2-oxoglutarate oxidoreductase [Anaerolineaceae bacterium]
EVQKHGMGFSFIELLSTCPTNWGLTPVKARDWLREYMIPQYPIGDFKVSSAVEELVKGG